MLHYEVVRMSEIEIDTASEAAALIAEKTGGDPPEAPAASGEIESTDTAARALRAMKGRAKGADDDVDDVDDIEAAADDTEGAEVETEDPEEEGEPEPEEEGEPEEPEEVKALRADAEDKAAKLKSAVESQAKLGSLLSEGHAREQKLEDRLEEAYEELAVLREQALRAGWREDPRDAELRKYRREAARAARVAKEASFSEEQERQAKSEAQKRAFLARLDGIAEGIEMDKDKFRLEMSIEYQRARVEKRAALSPEDLAKRLARPVAKKAPGSAYRKVKGKGGTLGTFPTTREGDIAALLAAKEARG